jgi:hypothetical protein
MFKTTLLGIANPIAFVLFFLFFNTTNAQSIVKKTKDEEKSLRFLKSPIIIITDLISSVETKENDVLINNKTSDSVCNNELVAIIKEADILDTNLDSILFVQYYKQFVVFYKNIS